MTQKTVTFTKYVQKTFPKDYAPNTNFTVEDETKQQLLKLGYVVANIDKKETVTINCVVGKYNVPLEERKKLQKKLDKTVIRGDKINLI